MVAILEDALDLEDEDGDGTYWEAVSKRVIANCFALTEDQG